MDTKEPSLSSSQPWFSDLDQTVQSDPVNREPLINLVLLTLRTVLCIKSMKPFKPWLNCPSLKTNHCFHGSNQSIKKNFFLKKKLSNHLLLACLSITLFILSLSTLKSSISCLFIKFGSFFTSDKEEKVRWDRENERSCWS